MIFADNPQLREGDFGLCDLNLGYLLPAIDAGWQLIGLPFFSKRKSVYPFIFCRVDSGIDSPKGETPVSQIRRADTQVNSSSRSAL
jgi:hypothetical protein